MKKFLLSLSAMFLTIMASAQVVFDFDNNYQQYFPTLPGVSSGSNDSYVADGEFNDDQVVVVDGVTVTIKASAADAATRNRVWASSPRLRMYNESFSIKAAGHKVTAVEFDTNDKFNVTAAAGTLSGKQWTGSEDEVVFSVSKNTQIRKMTITLDTKVDVVPEVHIANTAETAYTVGKAHELIEAGEALSEEVYVKGKVVSVVEISLDYGNATYFISDDGSEQNQLEVYRGFALNGDKFAAEDQLKAGDEVVVCGKLVDYKGTHEFTTGSKLYSINGATAGGDTPDTPTYEIQGQGTLENPYTAMDVINLLGKVEATEKYWVEGTILGFAKSGSSYVTEYDEKSNTNLAIGTEDAWVPVALPANSDARTALNLAEHPSYTGKTVKVYGTIEKYFSVAGVKNVADYRIDGVADAISEVKTNTSKVVYNLMGQRVAKAQKGLYIQNGKVVLK